MRERFVVVTEEGKYFFVHKVELENTHKKISLAANSELSRRNFFTRVKKYLKDDKVYIFRENMLENRSHLGTDIVRRQISVHIFAPI